MSISILKQNEEALCVICHESLEKEAIGTTVPCGHVFHQACFGIWINTRQCPRQETQVQCPICNGLCSYKTPFIRLYFNKNDCRIINFEDKIKTLQGRIHRLNKKKGNLVEKEVQFKKKNKEIKQRLHVLISEINIVRSDHDTALSDLKEAKLALNHTNATLQKLQEETKESLDCSNRKMHKSQVEAEAAHNALVKKSQQVSELSQRLDALKVKHVPKQKVGKKRGY
jgi:uncharacterized coiled-coil DUF342 family protein